MVSQLRTERASAQALAKATAEYTERGFTIIDDDDRWGWKLDRVPLRHLQRVGDDGQAQSVDETAIADPQYWAVRFDEYTELVDTKTGEVVDEGSIDWDTEDDPDAQPAQGLRHADSRLGLTLGQAFERPPAWLRGCPASFHTEHRSALLHRGVGRAERPLVTGSGSSSRKGSAPTW